MDWIDFRPMLLLPLYQQKPTAFISLAFHKIRQQYLVKREKLEMQSFSKVGWGGCPKGRFAEAAATKCTKPPYGGSLFEG